VIVPTSGRSVHGRLVHARAPSACAPIVAIDGYAHQRVRLVQAAFCSAPRHSPLDYELAISRVAIPT
jgi:hypothetical protein